MPVLLTIKDVRVRSLEADRNEISWKIEDTSEDVLDYSFQILRSESPSGPFEPISVPFFDRYTFTDNAVRVGHRWRVYYYLVRTRHVPSGDEADTPPAAREAAPDLITSELRRHMLLLMREFAGRRVWVLPVRTFGSRCSCYNKTLGQRQRTGCRACFDTSFVRGFLHPIETWAQIDPSAKTEQTTNVGAQQQSNTTARFPFYPPLKPRDVVVEAENRRWRVVSVSQTEKGRAPVHQEVQLHEIPPKDIEFAIPLVLGAPLASLEISPARNYTNPQNLESFLDEEVPAVLALYGKKTP